jgi:hypothetical protein
MTRASHRTLVLVAFAAGCASDIAVTKIDPEISVSPIVSDLGAVPVGAEVPFQIQVDSIAGGDVQIRSVDVLNVDGTFFEYVGLDSVTVPSGESVQLDLVYRPTSAGWHRATVTVGSDAKQSSIQVDARAQAIELDLFAFPSLLDFGVVGVGDTASRVLTLQNDGTVDVPIDDWGVADPGFAVASPIPVTVPAGARVEITVTYTAPDPDPANDGLVLASGAAFLPSVGLRANDCEGGDPAAYDVDADGYTTCGGDCDDGTDAVHPGEPEVCDGLDNDCSGGRPDEGTECYDDDGDGYTEVDGDCNDGDTNVSPGTAEVPANGVDDDCNGEVDGGAEDVDGDGYSPSAGDCDDRDGATFPGAPELVDGVDNDCDGTVDEGTVNYDDDGDGQTELAGDCNDADPLIYAGATERSDWKDNDCDGTVDEGTVNYDDDGDGYTESGGDCNDANPAVYPPC